MIASIHGRFQPFHNGHLSYALAAFAKCKYLYIGITQIERKEMPEFSSAVHRSRKDANPLTFFERARLVKAALDGADVSAEQYSIIPFPIERIETLSEYFPSHGICFTTKHSEWNSEKISILNQAGYSVEVIAEPDRFVSNRKTGSEIRTLIRQNDIAWTSFVPANVAEIIQREYLNRFFY